MRKDFLSAGKQTISVAKETDIKQRTEIITNTNTLEKKEKRVHFVMRHSTHEKAQEIANRLNISFGSFLNLLVEKAINGKIEF